jgi:hypothetical protein
VTSHDELRLSLGAYAIGSLEPEEREALERHLEGCARCREELAELASLPAMLELARDMPAVAAEPSPLLEREVLGSFEPPARSRRPRLPRLRLALPSAALGAAAAVLLLFLVGALGGGGAGGSGEGGGTPMRVALRSLLPGSDNTGVAEISSTADGSRVHLDAALRPSRPGQIYQLWFVGRGGKVSAGTFRVGAGGHVDVVLNAAATPSRFEQIGIAREPEGQPATYSGVPVMSGPLPG